MFSQYLYRHSLVYFARLSLSIHVSPLQPYSQQKELIFTTCLIRNVIGQCKRHHRVHQWNLPAARPVHPLPHRHHLPKKGIDSFKKWMRISLFS